MGPPDPAKSTLLHLIAAMDHLTGGKFACWTQSGRAERRPDRSLAHETRLHFQAFNLIPVLTALETWSFLEAYALKKQERLEHAHGVEAGRTGRSNEHFPRHFPEDRSNACDRARDCDDPALILADEPTGNLDASSAQEFTILSRSIKNSADLVMVTHDPHAARFATKVRYLRRASYWPRAGSGGLRRKHAELEIHQNTRPSMIRSEKKSACWRRCWRSSGAGDHSVTSRPHGGDHLQDRANDHGILSGQEHQIAQSRAGRGFDSMLAPKVTPRPPRSSKSTRRA